MLPVLKNCISMYKDTGFKKVVSTLPKSSTAAMQLKKVIKEMNFDATFINSMSELNTVL